MTETASRASGFIGRREELAVLAAALDDALSGRGQMVMLAGEPGIGKTRLAQELASNAQSLGAQVLWGWCYEHAGAPPYWPYVQPIRNYIETVDAGRLISQTASRGAAIAEIVPELREKLPELGELPAAEPEQARFRLFDSVATFLKNVSQEQPLLLVIDDLHWADDSSLLLLEFLAREIVTSPLLIVGTYRDVEVTGDHPLNRILGNLARENHFQRMQLGGMTRQEIGELVEAGSGIAVAEDALSTLYSRTEGNPLFVGEVVAAVGIEVITRDSSWTASIPGAIREATVRRLSPLSENCKRQLRTASVVGRDFDIQLLRDLNTDIPEDDFLEGLDEALGIGVVESFPTRPGRYQFCHALIQQAVYEEISPIGKARAHAAVGEALERLHEDNLDELAGELAYHFAEAFAVSGTEKIVRYSLIAGERALDSFAYEQALTHFKQALEVKEGQADDGETAAARFGLGRAQIATRSSKDLREAHINLSRAFDYYESVGDMNRIVEIAEFPRDTLDGDGIMVVNLISRALTVVPSGSHEAGRLYSSYGKIRGMEVGDFNDAQYYLDQALTIARREGDTPLEIRTLAYAANINMWNLQYQDAVARSLEAIELAKASNYPRDEVRARYFGALAMRAIGDTRGQRNQAPALLAAAEKSRDRFSLMSAYSTAISVALCEGDWEAGREATDLALDIDHSDPRIISQRVVLEFQSGNTGQGTVFLDRLIEEAARSSTRPNTSITLLALTFPLAASISTGVMNLEPGRAAVETVLAAKSATPLFIQWANCGGAVRAVLEDDAVNAQRFYDALKPSPGLFHPYLSTDRILGLLAGILGHVDQSETHFIDALSFCRNAGYRPELAWACHDYGQALIERDAAGDRGRAIDLLEESLAISGELGMRPLMERITALQERAETLQVRVPGYPDGLTAREVEVLRMVAVGKTDKAIADELFIGVRTVSFHVGNILDKTGSANRTEAASYANQWGLL